MTISMVSTKHWVAEIGLSKLQIGTKIFEGVLQLMVSPNFGNEIHIFRQATESRVFIRVGLQGICLSLSQFRNPDAVF